MFAKNEKKKNLSSSLGPYFKPMLELGFHNPNQVIFEAENSLDFPTNKNKPRT
jgi:hypothetical protein